MRRRIALLKHFVQNPWKRDRRSPLPLFLRSRDVRGMIVCAVAVQRWTDAQEKLKSVAEIVAVIVVKTVRAIIYRKLGAKSDIKPVAMRQVAHVSDRVTPYREYSRFIRWIEKGEQPPGFCRLDFRARFYLNRGVPADDEVTSLLAIGAAAAGQNGGFAFATTHWSMVLEAHGPSPAAEAALEKLCRTYWRPIYGFVRRQGIRPEEAEDLTQGFFALLLERRDLSTVRKEKGRLRSYLLASVKHFLADEWRHAMAVKRGKGHWLIPLEELRESEAIDVGRSDRLTPDQIYERRWALTVLEQVLARLRDEYRSAGNLQFFDRMKKMLMDEPGRPSQAQIASEFEMTENAVKQAFYRFRQRYQTLLREEIAHTVAMPSDIEDELRHLIAVVRA